MMDTFAEFQETMTLTLPNIRGRMEDLFGESADTKISSHGIIVELAAIHEGLTSNFNNYKAEELEAALDSWVNPYPKPILLNHDLEVDPLGRIMAAKMDKEKDGSLYTRLQIAVTDPAAVAKVMDQRYLTGSVGGKSNEALCSVCGKDWAQASAVSLPCKHTRGKTFKGSLAFLDRKGLSFKEYSFVNAPADARSSIRTPESEEDGSREWIRTARVFDLNMDRQEITEFEESENRSVLEHMRSKEAGPIYLQLKGAFITALSAEAAGLGMKESSDVETDQDEDILALSEELSDDLATVADEPKEDAVATEEAEQDTEVQDGESDAEEEVPTDESSEEEVEAAESDNNEDADGQDDGGQEGSVDDAEEAEFYPQDGGSDRTDHKTEHSPSKGNRRAQGMEVPREKHDPNVYSRPMIGDAGTQRRGVETSRVDKSREADDADQNLEESEDTDLNEAVTVLERRVSELTEREEALLEENTRLKKALHRTLAERVVDGKIALGMADATEREELLVEHAARTASSLADNLRDLAKVTFKRSTDPSIFPTMDEKSNASPDPHAEEAQIVILEEADQALNPEEVFTDVLMGRRKL